MQYSSLLLKDEVFWPPVNSPTFSQPPPSLSSTPQTHTWGLSQGGKWAIIQGTSRMNDPGSAPPRPTNCCKLFKAIPARKHTVWSVSPSSVPASEAESSLFIYDCVVREGRGKFLTAGFIWSLPGSWGLTVKSPSRGENRQTSPRDPQH